MNPELILAHFSRISDAPDAIRRMRHFILDLAVRGKLVEQNPTDEIASALLEKIKQDKVQMLLEKHIRAEQSVEYSFPDAEIGLPSTWAWAYVDDVAIVQGGKRLPNGTAFSKEPTSHIYIRVTDMKNGTIISDDLRYVTPEVQRLIARYTINRSDLYITIAGTIGQVGRVPDFFDGQNLTENAAKIVFRGLDPDYLRIALSSEVVQGQFRDKTKQMAQPKLALKRILGARFPLPPLAEQRRVVTKVEELMNLCDQLEAAKTERENRRDRLAAASHHHLNNELNPEAFRRYATFYFGHLPRLILQPEQIKPLRQTILNLAVRGQLVRQDPNDEPVSKLLMRIRSQKAELLGARALERESSESSLSKDDLPFSIPSTWQWEPLQSVIVFGPQNGISPKTSSRPDAPRAITLTATTKGTFDSRFFKRVDASIPLDSEFWLRSGDLLFQRGNTREYVGMAAYYTGEPGVFLYPDLMMKVRVSDEVNLRYIHLCSVAPHARNFLSTRASGAQSTMPKINQGILVKMPIPLPPLAEQRRIVAKVDELMTLCDRLETQVTNVQHETSRLLESVLHYALTTPEAFSNIANPARQGEAHA